MQRGTIEPGQTLLKRSQRLYPSRTDQGFTVGAVDDTATTGIWERVDPNGTSAQPEDDHSPNTGTSCYVTGQGAAGGQPGANDVDGGKTTLFSPVLDLSGFGEPWLGYWRWYSNDAGGGPGEDTFVVDLSNDGGSGWSNVETVGPTGPGTGGGWLFHAFRVSDVLAPTAQMQLRFVASDLGSGSLVEAAIDDLVLIDCASCAATTPAEVANLGLALSGSVASLSWDAEPEATSYAVYRGLQQDASDLTCFLSDVAGTSTMDDGLVPAPGLAAFYVTTAVNCAGESALGSDRAASVPCP